MADGERTAIADRAMRPAATHQTTGFPHERGERLRPPLGFGLTGLRRGGDRPAPQDKERTHAAEDEDGQDAERTPGNRPGGFPGHLGDHRSHDVGGDRIYGLGSARDDRLRQGKRAVKEWLRVAEEGGQGTPDQQSSLVPVDEVARLVAEPRIRP